MDKERILKVAPSKEAVVRYLTGEQDATKALIMSFIQRSFLIAGGIYLLGDKRNLLKNSLSASLAIELYLLYFYKKQLEN